MSDPASETCTVRTKDVETRLTICVTTKRETSYREIV